MIRMVGHFNAFSGPARRLLSTDYLARWSRALSNARTFTFLRSDGSERETLIFAQM